MSIENTNDERGSDKVRLCTRLQFTEYRPPLHEKRICRPNAMRSEKDVQLVPAYGVQSYGPC
jgi:hypothetical protein